MFSTKNFPSLNFISNSAQTKHTIAIWYAYHARKAEIEQHFQVPKFCQLKAKPIEMTCQLKNTKKTHNIDNLFTNFLK
jgi:hypothetical protein